MAEHSQIEWTDATWNIITGCTLVDEGCRHCYAAQLAATRLQHHPSRAGLARVNAAGEAKFTGEVRFNEEWLDQPLRWSKPRMIFVCAHGDLFHENVPDEWIDKVFAVMALAPQHTFQVLTKRPDRARDYLRPNQRGADGRGSAVIALGYTGPLEALHWPLPNVWLGTSVSDQASADSRIPTLLEAPAAVRFLSAEPLLGSLDLRKLRPSDAGLETPWDEESADLNEWGVMNVFSGPWPRLDWVIVGGESGAKARPMNPQWVRDLRDQCVGAGVAYFFKQWGEWVSVSEVAGPGAHFTFGDGRTVRRTGKRAAGRTLDGEIWSQMPEVWRG